jgi:hypothetical protein
MKKIPLALVAALALLVAPLALRAQAKAAGDEEGFRSEGSVYVSVASGEGRSALEAESAARGAAQHRIFDELGLDALFAEVFTSSPPIGLTTKILSASHEGTTYKTKVELRVDDESIRILQRGPYLAAATSLLDKAESGAKEAEARRSDASDAEAKADLGPALGQYGMAADSCRAALDLLSPLADPSIFSTAGKRTAPELKKSLASILAESEDGIERVKKAQSALESGVSDAERGKIADDAVAAATAADAFLDAEAESLRDPSACSPERLAALRDRLESERHAVQDAQAGVERSLAAIPAGEKSFSRDKLDYASRRLATAEASLSSAYKSVDREIRDPAAQRAARAAALRWAFLHEPAEYASLRAYMPFALGRGERGLESSLFEGRLQSEGGFAFGGSGGIWLRTRAIFAQADLSPAAGGGLESAFTRSFDLGFWGKGLFFGGYEWDWSRRVDGVSLPKDGTVSLGFGGVYPHGKGAERFYRADWLLSFRYQIPYDTEALDTWDLINGGVEAQFRLGSIALFEASAAERLDERAAGDYVALFSWGIGLGIRLPAPFAIGAEYSGLVVRPLLSGDSFGEVEASEGSVASGRFRFYLQYSI